MKYDIICAGVGGQGVLSLSALIAGAATTEGLQVKQSEVHGMAQRGGAVQAQLRISSRPIASDLIPRGSADLVLSMEPLESLRYLGLLSPSGVLVTSSSPVTNIPNYPALEEVLNAVRAIPRALLVDSVGLARGLGAARSANMVMVGAASRWLPVTPETLSDHIEQRFASKGAAAVAANLAAFRAGQNAAQPASALHDVA